MPSRQGPATQQILRQLARPPRTAGAQFASPGPWESGSPPQGWTGSAVPGPPRRRTPTETHGISSQTTRPAQTGSARSTPGDLSIRHGSDLRRRQRRGISRRRALSVTKVFPRHRVLSLDQPPGQQHPDRTPTSSRIDATVQCCPLPGNPRGGLTPGCRTFGSRPVAALTSRRRATGPRRLADAHAAIRALSCRESVLAQSSDARTLWDMPMVRLPQHSCSGAHRFPVPA